MDRHFIDINDYSNTESKPNRQKFIIKTLSIVAAQLFVTAIITYFCYTSNSFRSLYPDKMLGLFIGALVGSLVSMLVCFITVSCWRNKIIALFSFCIFTICMSILFAIGCLAYDVQVLVQAVSITCLVVVLCVGFILITKVDLHSFRGILFCGLMVLIIGGIVMAIFPPSNTIQIVFAFLGVIIFTGYILVDTSDLVNGRYNDDEYLLAAIGIYLDIINLLLYMMRLLKECDSSDI